MSTSTMLRWSSARDCTRKALLEREGEPERERTLQEERTLARGRDVGRGYLVQLCAEQRWSIWADSGPFYWIPPALRAKSREAADVVAELRVPWKYGVGHADAWISSTDTILEVLSSQAGEAMRHSKEVQAALYMIETGAHNLQVTVVNPVDLSEERTTLTRDSHLWPALAQEVQERIEQLDVYHETGELPARVCKRPSDARGHFCLHAERCFEGWQPAPYEAVASPEAAEEAERHVVLRTRERELQGRLDALKAERKEVEERLAHLVEPGTWQVGLWEVTRSVRERRSFKYSLAERDERFPLSLLEEFTSLSSYEVFTVKPAEVLEDDTVPF